MIVHFDKRCPACGATKPLTAFHRNSRNPDGRATYCAPCAGAAVKRTLAKQRTQYEAAVALLSREERAKLGR